MRRISVAQAVIACVTLVTATVAAGLHDISGGELITLYTAVVGYALGYVNGNKTTLNELGRHYTELTSRVNAVENK